MSDTEKLPQLVEVVPAEEVEVLSPKESMVRRWLFEAPVLGRGPSGFSIHQAFMDWEALSTQQPEGNEVEIAVTRGVIDKA